MNVLEREKIRRQLYKQEKLKKKLEEEEKLKYPGINGLIRIDNISQYFIFDEDEKNVENTLKNNIEVEYEINSYLNNEDVPDLYTPYGIISGNNYNLITTKDKDMSNENGIAKDDNIDKENKEDNNNDDSRRIKRYFDIDKDSLYFLRCKKCGKYGHTKANCIKENNFCYICIKYGHVKKDCPIFLRCYKCLKYGHKIQNCTADKLEPLCQNCNRSIHKKEDCLKCPDEITIKDLEKHNLKCEFCGSKKHLICPYSKRENYILLYEKKDKNKDIDKEMNKIDYSHQLFCPWCGGNHLKIECPERRDNKSFSERSEIKSINSEINNSNIKGKYSNDDYWGSDTDQLSDKKNNSIKENKKEKDNNKYIQYDDFQKWGEDNQEKDNKDNNWKNEVKKETHDNHNIKDFQHPRECNSKNTNTNINIKNDKKNEKMNWGNKSSFFNSKSNFPNNNNHKLIKYNNYYNNNNNKERNIYKTYQNNNKKNYNNNRDYRYEEKKIYNNYNNNEIKTNNQSINLREEENNNYDGNYNKNNNYRYNYNKNNKNYNSLKNYYNYNYKDKPPDIYECYKNKKQKNK